MSLRILNLCIFENTLNDVFFGLKNCCDFDVSAICSYDFLNFGSETDKEMKRLRHQDWKNLFSALSVLHLDVEPETLSERCVASANKLISTEITAFDFFIDKGVHTGTH